MPSTEPEAGRGHGFARGRPFPPRRVAALVAGVGGAALLATLLSATAEAQPELPEARDVLDRYADAVGGVRAWEEVTGLTATGTFAIPEIGVTGTLTLYTALPDRMIQIAVVPGFGATRTAYDGEIGWLIDPVNGPRVLGGGELDFYRDQAAFHSDLRRPADIASATVLQRTEVRGQPCYELEIVFPSDRRSRECYHAETGLRMSSVSIEQSPEGAVEVRVEYHDWRDFDGVLLPARVTRQVMGQRQVVSLERVEFGEVDPAVFERPAEIRALLD